MTSVRKPVRLRSACGTVEPTKITPPELARRWGLSVDKILTWIRSGELRAIDAATRRGGRPRFLIDVRDIALFEAARSTTASPTLRPVRRRRKPENVTEFF